MLPPFFLPTGATFVFLLFCIFDTKVFIVVSVSNF